jgi:hypothetical protein
MSRRGRRCRRVHGTQTRVHRRTHITEASLERGLTMLTPEPHLLQLP